MGSSFPWFLVSTMRFRGLSSYSTMNVHILPLDSSAETEQGSPKAPRAFRAIMFLFCSTTLAAMLRLSDMSAYVMSVEKMTWVVNLADTFSVSCCAWASVAHSIEMMNSAVFFMSLYFIVVSLL